jgi:transposase
MKRRAYSSDVSDEEWAFIAPDLTLMTEDAPQRVHDLPPWEAVYQQTQRWFKAGGFEAIVDELRVLLRVAKGRTEQPSAVIIDSRTLQSSPESGERAGYDGGKRKKRSKVHIAVDTLGHLLALCVTPANQQDRELVQQLTQQVQQITGQTVEVAVVDSGYTGEQAAVDAAAEGIRLEVVKLPEANRGFILLPRRWVVERSFAWSARFRHLTRDFERVAETLIGFHLVAFGMLMLKQFVHLGIQSA